MGDWSEKIIQNIEEQLKGVRDKDLRFFRIEEFFRMTRRVDEYASSCRDCNSFKYEIEKISDDVSKAVKYPGRNRIRFDRLQGKMAKHMRKAHGFYPPFYFTYLLSASYAFSASAAAILLSLILPASYRWFIIIPAFILGLITGNLSGAKKDAKVRNNQKLL